jgi:hypothetical protein
LCSNDPICVYLQHAGRPTFDEASVVYRGDRAEHLPAGALCLGAAVAVE